MKVNFLRRSAAAAILGAMILVLLPAVPAFALDATSTSPSALGQGVSNFDVTVLGSGFLPTDTVSFSPSTGITINSTTFVDTGHLTVNVSISPTATTGLHDVITTDNLPGGSTDHCMCFTVNAAPVITNVSPAALGQSATNVPVTFTGTGFVSGISLIVAGGGVTVGTPTSLSSTSITAPVTVTSGASTTSRNITATNADHGTSTCSSCIAVDAHPTITSFDPTSGSNTGSQPVDITGTNFVSGASVVLHRSGQTDIGGTSVSVTNGGTTLSATFDLSLAPPGTWNFIVTNPDYGTVTSGSTFTIAGNLPSVSDVSPAALGQGASLVPVTITGDNFANGATVGVSGTGVTVSNVDVQSKTTIVATMSVTAVAATTTRTVTVTNADTQSGSCSSPCLAIHTGPSVTSVTPTSGGQGESIPTFTITGTGFVDGATVDLGPGITVGSVVVSGGGTTITTSLTITTSAAPGLHGVTVTNSDHGSDTKANAFTVNPAITGASPSALGRGATNKVVTVTGSGFESGATLDFGSNITLGTVTFVDSSHLTVPVTVGSSATTGPRAISVTNPDTTTGMCATTCFAIDDAPNATSATPSALGRGASGAEVVIGGSGFVTGATVSVSGSGVTIDEADVIDATHIDTFISVDPGAATTARTLTVTNPDFGTKDCSCTLTIDAAPSINSVSPTAAGNTGQAQLTILGSNFQDTPAVVLHFGDQPDIVASNVTFNSSSSITATVDLTLAAPGSWDVEVINPDFGSDTCAQCLNVTGSTPTVTAADPSTIGQGASNVVVVLTGTHFANGANVSVSGTGVVVNDLEVISDTEIDVLLSVTGSAATGARTVTVTNTDGKHGSCSCLTVSVPPSASVITPAQRGHGTWDLTVAGAGFIDPTDVEFSRAGIAVNTVTVNSSSSLTVNITIAGGAIPGTSDVTFTTEGGSTSTCTACFTVTGTTSVTFTTPSAIDGAVVANFSQPVGGVTTSNFRLRLDTVASDIPGALTCTDGSDASTACSSGTVMHASLKPSTPLVAGQHYTAYIDSPGITDFGGLAIPSTTGPIRVLNQEAEATVGATFAWRTVNTPNAFGGSYVVEHLKGAKVSYPFNSSTVTLWTNYGPSYGTADVYFDGVLRGTYNFYSSTMKYRQSITFRGVSGGHHIMTIVVHGTKSSASTDTNVAVDAIQVGTTITSSPALTSVAWQTVSSVSVSGGKYVRSDLNGATASFTFRGTSVEWDTILGRNMGRAYVYVDGVLKASVDNYAASTHYKFARIYSGLTDAVHTIVIKVQGTHRTGAEASFIVIDRWAAG